MIDWNGDYKTLGSETAESSNRIRITSQNGHFVISKVEIRALAGVESPAH
jgi:hypothetical protein